MWNANSTDRVQFPSVCQRSRDVESNISSSLVYLLSILFPCYRLKLSSLGAMECSKVQILFEDYTSSNSWEIVGEIGSYPRADLDMKLLHGKIFITL